MTPWKKQTEEVRPKLIIGGTSAYSRIIDFERMSYIAKKQELFSWWIWPISRGLWQERNIPVPCRGRILSRLRHTKRCADPGGGIILCREAYAKAIDKAVFPGIQGGPLMHVIAGKAAALGEALTEDFHSYAVQIKKDASALAGRLMKNGLRIVSGGTDTLSCWLT